MKIAAIAKVIKDRGSCHIVRIHGAEELKRVCSLAQALNFTRWKGSLSRGQKRRL